MFNMSPTKDSGICLKKFYKVIIDDKGICLKIIIIKSLLMMMLFQSKLGLSVLDLLGRSADSVRWTPLQKQETKRIGGAHPLPLRCLSQFFPVEEKINCLGNEVLCICLHTFCCIASDIDFLLIY